MHIFKSHRITFVLIVACFLGHSQQDPQFTHYNYNTMTVNPGYTGSRGHLAILSLYRSQWAGIEGSPQTITFGIDSPIGITDGVGLSIIQDIRAIARNVYRWQLRPPAHFEPQRR